MARESRDGFWMGFILGTFVGAVMALLFAPAPGEETRDRLRERGIELRERAEELSEEAKKRAQEALEEGRRAAEERRSELRSKLEAQKEGTEA